MPATGPGTRSHGTGRRLTPPPARGRSPSHRIWAGHSLRGSIIMLRIFPFPITGISNEVIRPAREQRRRKLTRGQLTRISVCIHASQRCYIRALLAGVFCLAHRDSFRFLLT
jgi:hypothetical protein